MRYINLLFANLLYLVNRIFRKSRKNSLEKSINNVRAHYDQDPEFYKLFLDKKISVKELKEKVLIKTRQYAKRQRTWQRGQMQDWKGFVDVNYLDLLKKVLSYLSKT